MTRPALVRTAAGATWTDPDTGEVTAFPAVVRLVVLQAAERALRNPHGYTYRRADGPPGVHLTDAEHGLIRRAVHRHGLWSQPTTRADRARIHRTGVAA